ncbi:MAG TPA: hypothetical protein VGN80_05070 [Devosiaceae bacterium]|nr:hypothetical protein [Devosiaceae bacterium]
MTGDLPERRRLALLAAERAAQVLPLFETHRPSDLRPRNAIDAARAWANGDMNMAAARKAAFAAHGAAREASNAAATAAARAAGHAAATAHVAGHARHVEEYALKAEAAGAEAAHHSARRKV